MRKANARMLVDYVNYCACWSQLDKYKRMEILNTITIKIDYVEALQNVTDLERDFLMHIVNCLKLINALGCICNELDSFDLIQCEINLERINKLYGEIYA